MDISERVNRALKYRNLGEFDKAEQIYFDILKEQPDNSVILSFLGVMYYELGNYKDSEKYLIKSYDIKPNNVAIKLLGFVYCYLSDYDNAEKFLRLTAEFDKTPEVINKLVSVLLTKTTGYNHAYKYSLELYKKYPFNVENIVHLSEICLNIGKFKESEDFCNKALKLDSKYSKAWIQKGKIEEVLKCDNDEAVKCFKKSVRLGDKSEGYYNLSVHYILTDRKKSNYYAKYLLKTGISNRQDELHHIIGTNYFAMRKMKQGFKYYVHSWDNMSGPSGEKWQGETLKDKSLYVHFTQGFGDQIMFARYLPLIADKVKNIKIRIKPELYDLFKNSYSNYSNIEICTLKDYPSYDKWSFMMFLPYYLNIDFKQIPYRDGYLSYDKEKAKIYKKKYFNTDKLKAGICWRAGGALLRTELKRSIPLSYFEKMLNINDVQFYSFTKESDDVCSELFKSLNIIDAGTYFKSFDDTAAALKNLDVLITVDTSVAHLAGALGVKTLMLLPHYTDWRWFDETEKTDWYSSVKIFKQKDKKYWDKEIDEVCQNLRIMLD